MNATNALQIESRPQVQWIVRDYQRNGKDMWERLVNDVQMALHAGNPPLYMQVALATMIFIVIRLYQIVRRWRRAATPPNEWITGGYLLLLGLLSLGTWDYIRTFYTDYFLHVLHVYRFV